MTLDDLQNGYYIWQYEEGFRFGMDAVLLSSYAKVRRNECVLDLGTGTGIIPLLLASRTESSRIRGIELFAKNAELAKKSISYNSLEDRIEITEGDIRDIRSFFGSSIFDVVVSNPPYMTAGCGLISDDEEKAAARHEIRCTIYDVACAAAYVLKGRGRFYMVHRPERLADIFRALSEARLEPKRMRFVHPHAEKGPNLVLLEAQNGASPGLKVEKPLIVYDEEGKYTAETLALYGDQNL